ncbi:hypothetical protein [Azospirillum sp. B510]|uniref:hypothetical protein n=1 Tax=Azospirillum sp. (strain B510) TaxID=137722 RepID=UPI0002EFC9E3|nr:hypothetical protein [Azospirillum sp. B510]
MQATMLFDVGLLIGRQIFLFAHLVAFAFSFVTVIRGDWAMLRGDYFAGRRDLGEDAKQIAWLLAILWLSGLGLIALGPGLSVQALTGSPKILAKLTVVFVLTGNGLLLHNIAFPALSGERRALPPVMLSLCLVLGAVSTTSWLFAGLIGAARVVAPLLNYQHYMAAYTGAMAIGVLVALFAVRPLMLRHFPLSRSGIRSASGQTTNG